MAQSVSLCMIVKNEAHCILRCLDSVRPYITHWAIVDTGSTDGTQRIIDEALRGLPGKLIERPWTDFSTARNQAFDLARQLGYEYGFVIDADETLVKVDPEAEWGPFSNDSYAIRIRMAETSSVWCRRQLFKLSKPWRYEDEIHEHAECDGQGPPGSLFGFEIHSHNDSARNHDKRATALRDAKILRGMLKRRPNDPRLTYYLAGSYATAGEIDKSIEQHERRLTLGGFPEELFASSHWVAVLREARGDHWEDVAQAYRRAYEMRPSRAEPLWALAVLHNDRGMPALGELYARAALRIGRPHDALMVDESVYQWRAADELAGALAKLGRLDEALTILRRMVSIPGLLPPFEHQRVVENIRHCERGLLDCLSPAEIKALGCWGEQGGLLSVAELETLTELLRLEPGEKLSVLEIGHYYGLSTCALVHALKQRAGDWRLTTVDSHATEVHHADVEEFEANKRRHFDDERLTALYVSSQHYAPTAPIDHDVVFYDGDHELEQIRFTSMVLESPRVRLYVFDDRDFPTPARCHELMRRAGWIDCSPPTFRGEQDKADPKTQTLAIWRRP